jgi:DNA (cytosine-5)-methyltransferase 1
LGRQSGASATFWHFIKNLSQLGVRRPRIVALENVTGFVSSRAGRDISAAIRALNGLGYSIDVLSIDARRFVPQSRPRLFLIGDMDPDIDDPTPSELRPSWLDGIFSDPNLRTHRSTVPTPPPLNMSGFTAIADRLPDEDSRWWDKDRTDAFRSALTELQEERLNHLMDSRHVSYRSAYRRMRNGKPRWEIRADDIAGCLRTARGGSSRQAVVEAGFGKFRARWMTPHEYASLMGVPRYALDNVSSNNAYSGFGDAVCVPVVRWLAENCLVPRLAALRAEVDLLEESA